MILCTGEGEDVSVRAAVGVVPDVVWSGSRYKVTVSITSRLVFPVPIVANMDNLSLKCVLVHLSRNSDKRVWNTLRRAPPRSVRFVWIEHGEFQEVVTRGRPLLCSEAVSGYVDARRKLDMVRVGYRYFAAARASRDDRYVVLRHRKRRRYDPASVKRKVLWSNVGRFLRNAKNRVDCAEACVDALMEEVGEGKDVLEQSNLPALGHGVSYKDKIVADVVACLLHRRRVDSMNTPQSRVTRGFRADASPKLHAEIMALQIETVVDEDVPNASVMMAPGSTLAHGNSRLSEKTITFLWGMFLLFGPTLDGLQRGLDSIHWVTTDLGTEAGLASVENCLPYFWHMLNGGAEEDAPPNPPGQHLLRNVIFIPGWNHMISNVCKKSVESFSGFPTILEKCRKLVKFLGNATYRRCWARALEDVQQRDLAAELKKPWSGNFISWRWNSTCDVVRELTRLQTICTRWFV